MSEPEIKDDNLRLILSDQEIEYRDGRIKLIRRERVIFLTVSVVLFMVTLFLHLSAYEMNILYIVSCGLMAVLLALIGMGKTLELKKYRGRDAEHRAFLAKYNRLDPSD